MKCLPELLSTYPNRVKTSSGNVRVLSGKDPDATSNKKAKRRYERIVKNKPHIHIKVMQGLRNQLKVTEAAVYAEYRNVVK